LKVAGREHVKEDESYIVISNRQSHYDIPVLHQALGIPMQVLEIKEISRIPFVAMLSGKQILPVTINGTQGISSRMQLSKSARYTASVTISAPIDLAMCSPDKLDSLVTVVEEAIERHLPAA
jgi:1-acyl-sn-glycerol-3-phosphate acyltransferase